MPPVARMRKEPANRVTNTIRVHDIIIRGNTRTKDTVIESEVEELLRGATTSQELRHAAAVAEERLRALEIFESVNVRVDAGPPELPGTANVVIKVSEPSNPFAGQLRSFAKSAGDIWDTSGLGVFLPRFDELRIPFPGRMSLLDSLPLSLALGILSSGNHDLSYYITWSSLPGPPQPGYSLLSYLMYSFKVDQRDSRLRPTKGFAFLSTTGIGGLYPEPLNSRFIRQMVELRHAIPLGFYGAALNLGVSAGVEFSCSFHRLPAMDLGPAEPRIRENAAMDLGPAEPRIRENAALVHYGWELLLRASADLSFDLPLKVLRDAGIYGHVSAITGCILGGFSWRRLMDSLGCNVFVGVIIPTRLFRMEVNYCHGFHDQGKKGVELKFLSS